MQGCLRQQAVIACSVEEIFRSLDRCNRPRSNMLFISATCLWGASIPETPSDALSAASWRTPFEISRSYSRCAVRPSRKAIGRSRTIFAMLFVMHALRLAVRACRFAASGRFRLIFMLLIIPSSLALGQEGTQALGRTSGKASFLRRGLEFLMPKLIATSRAFH
jgi:hypothetical protein